MQPLVRNVASPTDGILNSTHTFHRWLRSNTTTGHHLTGTCRMGPDTDNMSVVDSSGHVKGIENLFIADASIMPESVRANTNATTMMLGEKISDYLKTRYLLAT
jgi:choline dehydrogenase